MTLKGERIREAKFLETRYLLFIILAINQSIYQSTVLTYYYTNKDTTCPILRSLVATPWLIASNDALRLLLRRPEEHKRQTYIVWPTRAKQLLVLTNKKPVSSGDWHKYFWEFVFSSFRKTCYKNCIMELLTAKKGCEFCKWRHALCKNTTYLICVTLTHRADY